MTSPQLTLQLTHLWVTSLGGSRDPTLWLSHCFLNGGEVSLPEAGQELVEVGQEREGGAELGVCGALTRLLTLYRSRHLHTTAHAHRDVGAAALSIVNHATLAVQAVFLGGARGVL